MSGFWESMERMSQQVSCGKCEQVIFVYDAETCHICGRMICRNCNSIYGACEFHYKQLEGKNVDSISKEFKGWLDAYQYIAHIIHENAKAHGWWDSTRNDGEAIALMHSELSECLEAIRHGDPPSDHIPEYRGSEEELADVIIRIMDYSQGMGMDVAGAVLAKMQYNATREYKHGGKKF